uniref:MHC class I-like antigen recognition-like domain-containing protein n=1 Tax=Lates calcarifer TaxID=8187 RepID=A0A4W6CCQ8_LATCA
LSFMLVILLISFIFGDVSSAPFSSSTGGSHYLLLDEISHNLHQRGHEVRMLFHSIFCVNDFVPGFSYEGRADSYQTSTWSLGEKYIKEYNGWFLEQQTQFLLGRYQTEFDNYARRNRQALVSYLIMF